MSNSNRSVWLIIMAVCAVATITWIVKTAKPPTAAAESADSTARLASAKAVVPNQEHDFGVIDVGGEGNHAFIVKNTGEGELTLELVRTSCHCTLADIKNLVVAPGGETSIELAWQGTEPDDTFGHGALIKTNDPAMPQFNLMVKGKVRAKMAVVPELIYFSEMPLESERQISITLYSQAFDDVRITKIESTNPGLTIAELDAGPSLPTDTTATFTKSYALIYRTDRKVGGLHGTIRVHYEATGDTAVESPFEFHFTGETLGDLSLNGRNFTGKLLNMGTVSGARGGVEKAYLHVRNPKGDLNPRVVSVQPEFLQVRFGAVQRLSDTVTRYPMEVVVPAGSSTFTAAGGRYGEVVLATDHPDYPEVRFQAALVVGP